MNKKPKRILGIPHKDDGLVNGMRKIEGTLKKGVEGYDIILRRCIKCGEEDLEGGVWCKHCGNRLVISGKITEAQVKGIKSRFIVYQCPHCNRTWPQPFCPLCEKKKTSVAKTYTGWQCPKCKTVWSASEDCQNCKTRKEHFIKGQLVPIGR